MTLVADRFEIEQVAGQGGMGTVFRARDHHTDRIVALKLVEPEFANARFEREAELLSELGDPAIVRYVAHGALGDGRMYLAMEWLEGTPLDDRLRTAPLSVDDSLLVATRLAHALGNAHAMGIVHRDVKPANVILRGGHAAEATLVDFGIARTKDQRHAMTKTGVVIGTPAYMAPEQARAEHVDARADVFSLGCVLFECLCGRPAFAGEHVVAVLAKILLESPARVRALRPDVPATLDALVAKMLSKDPEARPADGTDVARRLAEIRAGDLGATPDSGPAAVGTAESRLATILLVRLESEAPGRDTALANLTAETAFTDAGQRFGVPMMALANGALVGVAVASETANDSAERAARCALAMRTAVPDATIVLATGRAVVGEELPVGTAIDEAASILSRATHAPAGIYVDEGTAALLETRFELRRKDRRIAIVAERKADARLRAKRDGEAPCVGRDRELSLLEATYEECIDEPVAQAVLLTAPPGMGKSRIRRAFVDRLEAREDPPQIWLGLADPIMAHAPFALASDVLRRALAIADDEPLDARRKKVRERTRDDRVAAFLGEIAGAPLDADAHPALRAAQNNAGLLAVQVEEALVSFALGETATTPLVIVLEDVHWADTASLKLFGRLLERLRTARLLVLALARPSIDETHPRLWEGARSQRIALQPLLKKAAAKIARSLLGEDADVDAILDRAEGNALFVEELARARLDGASRTELPLTVMAAAEARIAAISAEARVVLRAAAVFGERFWKGGVARLVGSEAAATIDDALDTLERADVIRKTVESRFRGETELVFRHAVVRDAAYAMLTEHDRRSAHALAAEWLETRIDDAVVLAHHYELGERTKDAARWHVQAAEDALTANAFDTLVEHARRAGELGVEGALAGRTQLALAQVTVWRGANPDARTHAMAAMDLLERGSTPWFTALGIAAASAGKLERHDDLVALAHELQATPATSEDTGRARSIARARAAMQLVYVGERTLADALVAGCDEEPGAREDPHVRMWLAELRYERAFATGYPIHPRDLLEASKLARSLGDLRTATIQEGNQCLALMNVGAFAEAKAAASAFLARAPRDDVDFLGFVRMLTDSIGSAVHGDARAYEAASAHLLTRNVRAGVGNRLWLAILLLQNGRIDEADAVNTAMFEQSSRTPPFRPIAVATASRIAVLRKDLARVAAHLGELAASVDQPVAVWARAFTYVACIEAHEALGQADAARAVLESGVAYLREAAAPLEEWRDSFLHRRFDCAELVAMASERGIIVE